MSVTAVIAREMKRSRAWPQQQVRIYLGPARRFFPLAAGSFGAHQIPGADIRGAIHRILAPGHRRPAIFIDQIGLLVAAISLFQRSELSGCIGAVLETD